MILKMLYRDTEKARDLFAKINIVLEILEGEPRQVHLLHKFYYDISKGISRKNLRKFTLRAAHKVINLINDDVFYNEELYKLCINEITTSTNGLELVEIVKHDIIENL